MAARKKTDRREAGLAAWTARFRRAGLEPLLHPQGRDDPPWRGLPLVLALAFAVRAAVALSGDFVLHPDEIMQYLEPAHRLVFGYGVQYWEYFYGARSWLVPGAIAGLLKVFDAAGLGQPSWYVPGIKLALCAFSLLLPAGMYFFARRHFGESTARAALLAGAFWYELAGFAHKPMTEFVAAVPLLALLGLCLRPSVDSGRTVWLVAFLVIITVATRMQYATLALALLAIVFVRTERKLQLALAAAALALAAGILDGVSWDSGVFHSYITNLRYNLFISRFRGNESPFGQYLLWLVLAGGGLSAVCLATSLCYPRRYGLLLGLIALTVAVHSQQAHKEYRFIFAVVPLWLMIGADLVVRLTARGRGSRWLAASAGTVFAAVSLAGILNALPYQQRVYQAWSGETGYTGFLRRQDPAFAVYRYLSVAAGVKAVWEPDRLYLQLPGYYYLHREIPFYDSSTGRAFIPDVAALHASVSHIVSANPALTVPGYSVERQYGHLRILRRDENHRPVREWHSYSPTIVYYTERYALSRLYPSLPVPPVNGGIRFTGPPPPPGGLKLR